MSITFTCPGCRKEYTVGDDQAGRTARCPTCNTKMRVPAAAPEPQPEPIPQAPQAAAPAKKRTGLWVAVGCGGGLVAIAVVVALLLPGLFAPPPAEPNEPGGDELAHPAKDLVTYVRDRLARAETEAGRKDFRPLHAAALFDERAKARRLVTAGANVNATDRSAKSGTTPLHWAAGKGHLALARMLLDLGAKVNTRDAQGLTPLDWAHGAGQGAVAEMLAGHDAVAFVIRQKQPAPADALRTGGTTDPRSGGTGRPARLPEVTRTRNRFPIRQQIRLPNPLGFGKPVVQNRYGYVDRAGRPAIAARYSAVREFFDGRAAVTRATGSAWYYIGERGETTFRPAPVRVGGLLKSWKCEDYSEGLAPVGRPKAEGGYEWGFVDTAGTTVIEPQYAAVTAFADGVAAVKDAGLGGRWHCVDRTGKDLTPPGPTTWQPDDGRFSEGLLPVKGKEAGRASLALGYVDKTGKLVLPVRCSRVFRFSCGLARIRQGVDVRVIDRTGRIRECEGTITGDFREDLAPVRMGRKNVPSSAGGGKFGYVGKLLGVVIDPKFDEAYSFSEGLGRVRVGGKYGYIDRTGEMVVEPQFAEAADFYAGLARVRLETGEPAYIERSGEIAWSPGRNGPTVAVAPTTKAAPNAVALPPVKGEWKLEGIGPERVQPPGLLCVTPDGRRVLFSQGPERRSRFSRSDLWMLDTVEGKRTSLNSLVPADVMKKRSNIYPAFPSPDGRYAFLVVTIISPFSQSFLLADLKEMAAKPLPARHVLSLTWLGETFAPAIGQGTGMGEVRPYTTSMQPADALTLHGLVGGASADGQLVVIGAYKDDPTVALPDDTSSIDKASWLIARTSGARLRSVCPFTEYVRYASFSPSGGYVTFAQATRAGPPGVMRPGGLTKPVRVMSTTGTEDWTVPAAMPLAVLDDGRVVAMKVSASDRGLLDVDVWDKQRHPTALARGVYAAGVGGGRLYYLAGATEAVIRCVEIPN